MLHIITFIIVCSIFLVMLTILLILRISRFQDAYFRRLTPEATTTPKNIPAWPTQAFAITSCSFAVMVSPNQHIEHTVPVRIIYLCIFYFCFSINPLPATSLTLQYFCTNKSLLILYQTLKLYLVAICLMHIEHTYVGYQTPQWI